MLFNSYTFWLFFALVMILYRFQPHRGQNVTLLIASYFFYGYWDWRFLFLLLFSTTVDFTAGQLIPRFTGNKRRLIVAASITTNLTVLGFFKYFGFFAKELSLLFQNIGLNISPPALDIILPVGISFYTFQTMSYTIDVYRGHTQPVRNFLNFALYVSFFPQLVAGPIERSSHLVPQIVHPRQIGAEDFREGLYHILIGLFKKIVVADNMAVFAGAIFQTPANELTPLDCLVGTYAFAFQIYGDFSGYSSIAQGVAKWLGFDLMFNFRHPYFAASPSDFWKRWHISLSSWLRDYLYIPLGGNRDGRFKTYRNLLLTMFLGGIWHGANWTFIAWGLFHGILLCAHRLIAPAKVNSPKPKSSGIIHLGKVFVMFHLVCLGWLFFRAGSIHQAGIMLGTFGGGWKVTEFAVFTLGSMAFYVLPLLAFEWWLEKKADLLALTKCDWPIRAAVYVYMVLMLFFFPSPEQNEFIYFQF
jgi:D-alanyl-lipoteichoic acid acyltransferase DltB (MBOAT superfamily)